MELEHRRAALATTPRTTGSTFMQSFARQQSPWMRRPFRETGKFRLLLMLAMKLD